jgi:hypothetical protein
MRITKEEVVAGHSALRVRGFLRRFERGFFMVSAAESFMQIKSRQAAEFINDMVALQLIEPTMPFGDKAAFQVATRSCICECNGCEANSRKVIRIASAIPSRLRTLLSRAYRRSGALRELSRAISSRGPLTTASRVFTGFTPMKIPTSSAAARCFRRATTATNSAHVA